MEVRVFIGNWNQVAIKEQLLVANSSINYLTIVCFSPSCVLENKDIRNDFYNGLIN